MPTLETAAQYALAKSQQLVDARELLAHPTEDAFGGDAHDRHLVGAMYLAGYAVECALKEYIIGKYGVPAHGVNPAPGHSVRLDEVVAAVSAATAINLLGRVPHTNRHCLHDLHTLWQAADFGSPPAAITASLGVCGGWQVEWRFVPPSANTRQSAEEFVKAAEDLVQWIAALP